VECPEVDRIRENDVIEINFEQGRITNTTTGEEYRCSAIPPHILELIRDGGLVPYLKKHSAELLKG